MPTELFSNPPSALTPSPWVLATLTQAINTTPAAGTIETYTVSATAPAALQGGQFRVVIDAEYMIVTVPTGGGNPWSFSRGAEGSTTTTHLNGANIYHLVTAGSLDALAQVQSAYQATPTDGSVPLISQASTSLDPTNGPFAVQLPTAVGFQGLFMLRNIGTAVHPVEVFAQGTQTIDGNPSLVLGSPSTGYSRTAVILGADSTNGTWRVLADVSRLSTVAVADYVQPPTPFTGMTLSVALVANSAITQLSLNQQLAAACPASTKVTVADGAGNYQVFTVSAAGAVAGATVIPVQSLTLGATGYAIGSGVGFVNGDAVVTNVTLALTQGTTPGQVQVPALTNILPGNYQVRVSWGGFSQQFTLQVSGPTNFQGINIGFQAGSPAIAQNFPVGSLVSWIDWAPAVFRAQNAAAVRGGFVQWPNAPMYYGGSLGSSGLGGGLTVGYNYPEWLIHLGGASTRIYTTTQVPTVFGLNGAFNAITKKFGAIGKAIVDMTNPQNNSSSGRMISGNQQMTQIDRLIWEWSMENAGSSQSSGCMGHNLSSNTQCTTPASTVSYPDAPAGMYHMRDITLRGNVGIIGGSGINASFVAANPTTNQPGAKGLYINPIGSNPAAPPGSYGIRWDVDLNCDGNPGGTQSAFNGGVEFQYIGCQDLRLRGFYKMAADDNELNQCTSVDADLTCVDSWDSNFMFRNLTIPLFIQGAALVGVLTAPLSTGATQLSVEPLRCTVTANTVLAVKTIGFATPPGTAVNVTVSSMCLPGATTIPVNTVGTITTIPVGGIINGPAIFTVPSASSDRLRIRSIRRIPIPGNFGTTPHIYLHANSGASLPNVYFDDCECNAFGSFNQGQQGTTAALLIFGNAPDKLSGHIHLNYEGMFQAQANHAQQTYLDGAITLTGRRCDLSDLHIHHRTNMVADSNGQSGATLTFTPLELIMGTHLHFNPSLDVSASITTLDSGGTTLSVALAAGSSGAQTLTLTNAITATQAAAWTSGKILTLWGALGIKQTVTVATSATQGNTTLAVTITAPSTTAYVFPIGSALGFDVATTYQALNLFGASQITDDFGTSPVMSQTVGLDGQQPNVSGNLFVGYPTQGGSTSIQSFDVQGGLLHVPGSIALMGYTGWSFQAQTGTLSGNLTPGQSVTSIPLNSGLTNPITSSTLITVGSGSAILLASVSTSVAAGATSIPVTTATVGSTQINSGATVSWSVPAFTGCYGGDANFTAFAPSVTTSAPISPGTIASIPVNALTANQAAALPVGQIFTLGGSGQTLTVQSQPLNGATSISINSISYTRSAPTGTTLVDTIVPQVGTLGVGSLPDGGSGPRTGMAGIGVPVTAASTMGATDGLQMVVNGTYAGTSPTNYVAVAPGTDSGVTNAAREYRYLQLVPQSGPGESNPIGAQVDDMFGISFLPDAGVASHYGYIVLSWLDGQRPGALNNSMLIGRTNPSTNAIEIVPVINGAVQSAVASASISSLPMTNGRPYYLLMWRRDNWVTLTYWDNKGSPLWPQANPLKGPIKGSLNWSVACAAQLTGTTATVLGGIATGYHGWGWVPGGANATATGSIWIPQTDINIDDCRVRVLHQRGWASANAVNFLDDSTNVRILSRRARLLIDARGLSPQVNVGGELSFLASSAQGSQNDIRPFLGVDGPGGWNAVPSDQAITFVGSGMPIVNNNPYSVRVAFAGGNLTSPYVTFQKLANDTGQRPLWSCAQMVASANTASAISQLGQPAGGAFLANAGGIAPIPSPLASGTVLTLTSGSHTDTVIVSTAGAAAGATLIPIAVHTLNFAYPIGTIITAVPPAPGVAVMPGNLAGSQVKWSASDFGPTRMLPGEAVVPVYSSTPSAGVLIPEV